IRPREVTTRISGSAHDFALGDVAEAGETSARQSNGRRRRRRRIRLLNRKLSGRALIRNSVDVEIWPQPSDDERRAILAALGASAPTGPDAYRSRWRDSGLDDLRDDAAAEDAG